MIIHRVADKIFMIGEDNEDAIDRYPTSGRVYVDRDPLTGEKYVSKYSRRVGNPIRSRRDNRKWCPGCAFQLTYSKDKQPQPWVCGNCGFISGDLPGGELRNGSMTPGYSGNNNSGGSGLTTHDNKDSTGVKTTKPITRSIGDVRKRSRFANYAPDPTDPKNDPDIQRILAQDSVSYLVDYKVTMPEPSSTSNEVLSSKELKEREQK
jgi:hypothetical protein